MEPLMKGIIYTTVGQVVGMNWGPASVLKTRRRIHLALQPRSRTAGSPPPNPPPGKKNEVALMD
eukprot:2072090-Karenia_brevis.AAC.1